MKILILISTLLFSVLSYAGSASSHIYILHINGVNTNIQEALDNLDSIEENINIKSNMITFGLLYNETHGLLTSDLWDVFNQKKQEGKNLSIDDYVLTYMKTYKLKYEINSPEYNNLKDKIKDLYKKDPSFVGKNLNELINKFHEIVKDNKNSYVLLISHSQGNLYANQLHDYLVNAEHFPESNLALFGIASPADRVSGSVEPIKSPRYYTASNDYVINSLRAFSYFIPSSNQPLESNSYLSKCNDSLCHGLVDSYLSDNTLRNKIINKISEFSISLKKNIIRNGTMNNIRLFVSMPQDLKNKIARGEFIDSNGKVICYVSSGNFGKCDEDIMSYLEIPYPSNEFDNYRYLFIGFDDKLNSGNYLVLGNLSTFYENIDMYFYGKIKSSLFYDLTTGVGSECISAELRDNNDYIDERYDPYNPFVGNYSSQVHLSYSSYLCSGKFPYLLYNNKALGSRITLF